LLKTESPSLWRSVSAEQLFLSTLMSTPLAPGPALTVAAHVPDFHHFRGSYGGKDVLPLYRDGESRTPNVTIGLGAAIAEHLGIATPSPEQLAAYVYCLLSGAGYQRRFATELATPGPRVPITADPDAWAHAVDLGTRLIWLQTFAERMRDPAAGRGATLPALPGLGWTRDVTRIPSSRAELDYDSSTQTLAVGDGRLEGVRPEVWTFTVSGMPVVEKWLGYRTSRGAGRAARSTSALDRIRPIRWLEVWSVELVELVTVLTWTCDVESEQAALLERVLAGPLVSASSLPVPDAEQRQVFGAS
jgi:hypothetical protein